ncbi:hypothetical protein CHU92_01510 [Flavobacterium cyanobacteriorum]|uniref:Uncharacterized protein n=1 Tax=Flavobacterium cyanobacteriorum TaxID=2022802 RepID=A0A255ZZY0_9FLAO|nr:hypothetical protein [Flavobacterium cyanobacteriorum]OYQ46370.1 hypothetical protein CHU92_01510 [Flavobacterium cyanobacteriorum]
MKRSSFYNDKPDNYKLFMYFFGEGEEYKNDKMSNGKTIKQWCETDYFKNGLAKKAKLTELYIIDNMLSDEPMNPFPKWYGQGYWRDLNLLPPKKNSKWYQARTYYWLQVDRKQNKVKYEYIKLLDDGFNTSFIFDEDNIIKFFKENPELLPKDMSTVKEFYYEKSN